MLYFFVNASNSVCMGRQAFSASVRESHHIGKSPNLNRPTFFSFLILHTQLLNYALDLHQGYP